MGLTLVSSIMLCDYCLEEDEAAPQLTFLVGSLTVVGLTVYDIVKAPTSVRETNRLTVRPWVPLRDRGAGLVATWRF